MSELTLEHLAPYLPYGLKLQFSYEDDTKCFLDHVTHYVEGNNIPKPIEP